MPRFFLETIAEDDIQITGADAHHIGYALRMRPGEHLTVCANNIDYDCVIREITKDTVFLDAVSKHACAAEPSVFVTLYQAVPKAGKLEEIIQKSIELGVSRIVPVLTARCVARPKAAEFQKKLPRLRNRQRSSPDGAVFRKLLHCIHLQRRWNLQSRQIVAYFCMRAAAFGFQKCH